MSDIALLQLVHVLLFVYWLGGDLGVFYASFFVADDTLSPAQRQTAAKILIGLDQGPRICMPLILAVGMHLAWRLGALGVPPAAIGLVWLLALAWLGMVLALHFGHGRAFVPRLTGFDFRFRIVMLVAILGTALGGLLAGTPAMPAWVAVKLLVFAGLVGCGLLVRLRFKPFMPAFAELMTSGPSEAVNQRIRANLASVRPFVLAIWGGLVLNAAIGVHLIQF